MLPSLSDLPELRKLDEQERCRVIRQWQRAADEPWSGYLLHVGFCLLIALSIAVVPEMIFPSLRAPNVHDWVGLGLLSLGLMLAQILYNRVILRRRRDLLQRVLEQRRAAP